MPPPPCRGAQCAPLRITTDLQKRDYLGPPPKPSGDSRGFGGESRSSGMSELSPQAEARDVELATTKGAASRTRRKASPLAGEVPPKGAEGGRSAQAPALPYCVDRSLHAQGRTLHPVSPSVICFANATSLVRGRLFAGVFSLTPSDEGRFPLSGGNGQRPKGVGMLSSAARLGERSPRFPCRARQGCRALHITGELSLLWDVFIHLLEIGRYCALFWTQRKARC